LAQEERRRPWEEEQGKPCQCPSMTFTAGVVHCGAESSRSRLTESSRYLGLVVLLPRRHATHQSGPAQSRP
jgi:hypothetical protein